MFLIENILGCIFWGLLAGVTITIGTYLLCRMLDLRPQESVVGLGVLAVLLIFCTAQSGMLTGALYAKGYISDIGQAAAALTSSEITPHTVSAEQVAPTASAEQIAQLCDEIADEYPAAKPLLSFLDFNDLKEHLHEGHGIVDAMTQSLVSELNAYILRRVLWMVGLVVVTFFVIAYFCRRRDYTLDPNAGADLLY